MFFFKKCFVLWVFFTVVSAYGASTSIAEELREIITEKGFIQGVDRKTRSIVEIGISMSREEPELVARTLAAWRISCRLNGETLSAMRTVAEEDYDVNLFSVIRKTSSGYISGVHEVARVTRRDKNGRLVVGVALRWTFKQECLAAESISISRGEEDVLAKAVHKIPCLTRMSGPLFWMNDDIDKRSYLLGIGVCKIKASSNVGVVSAIRLAQLRARRYLLFHFCQYNQGSKLLRYVGDNEGCEKSLESLLIVKQGGVIVPGMGAANVYENIITEDGRRYAVCVTCLLKDREATFSRSK